MSLLPFHYHFFDCACTDAIILPKQSGHGNDYSIAKGGNPHRGRQIYVREGCFYCHSQFTRLQDRGYGPLVRAGDYYKDNDQLYEVPHVLGTARTGPDLTNEGGRMSSEWQKAHLVNPRAVKPGSIMPSFSYLSDGDMNDLVSYIQTLGNKRTVAHYVEAPATRERRLIPLRCGRCRWHCPRGRVPGIVDDDSHGIP